MYSGDPIRDHEERERKTEEWLDSLPVCCECNQPIQDDECYEFDGELICPECLVENHRKHTANYID